MGFPMLPGMANGGLPVLTPGAAVGLPGWVPPGNGYTGGVGPVRTMGGRNNTFVNGLPSGRMPAPYARNDSRGMRGSGMQGPRGLGMPSGADAPYGSIGPREAVVGRQLRSYEDLDADKGEGTGELNY
jgi:hypothetical protein